jgi:hypothetical protein
MEERKKHQDECADANRRQRDEFFRNLCQECRNISPV